MLKILQARFQQYVNRELPDIQAGFRKGRGTRSKWAYCMMPTTCMIKYEEAAWSILLRKIWRPAGKVSAVDGVGDQGNVTTYRLSICPSL